MIFCHVTLTDLSTPDKKPTSSSCAIFNVLDPAIIIIRFVEITNHGLDEWDLVRFRRPTPEELMAATGKDIDSTTV